MIERRRLRIGLLIFWLVLGALEFAVVAPWTTARPRSKTKEGPAARLTEAPPSARSLQNPYTGNEKAAAAGRKLFEKHCAECHGRDARGLGNAANLRSPVIQNAPSGSLFWVLRNGRIRKGMPSWSQLPDQQLWQIVTYIKTLKTP